MIRKIYMDYAATTYVRQEVIDAMIRYMGEIYGNPSSLHSFGVSAKKAVEEAREKIGALFHALPHEIYFTSGGTESDNWAVKGIAYKNKTKGGHIITSKIEHPAVLNACRELGKDGFDITYLDVDERGTVDTDHLKSTLRKDTILVSVMAANNEIGTLQPIEEIGKIIKEKSNAVFHVDAVQAPGAIDIALDKLPFVDLMSFSAHKFYGPKGVGALFIRKGTRIRPLHAGGEQERGKRAGTENVPGIVGMAKALELAISEMPEESVRLASLRDRMIERVLSEIASTSLNGHRRKRLPNNANFSFDGIEGESLLMKLNAHGIAVSSGSACSSASLEPSHVLLAIGRKFEDAHGSCRLTFGKHTTQEDIDYTVDTLKKVIGELREMSPLWDTAADKP